MIKNKSVYITSDEDFKKLETNIDSIQKGYLTKTYDSQLGTIDEIKQNIWSVGKKLKVEIEYPYYDKEYLNEHFSYYVKTFNPPLNKTFRLIFYSKINHKYNLMGYIILVPTSSLNHIGRVSFDPRFLLNGHAHLILTECKIHHEGKKSVFKMFPHARQYGLAACGHISIWAVSKFVGSNWDRYSEKEFEQIVKTVNLVNPKTKLSPPELTVAEISGVLSEFGYRPLFKPYTEDNQTDFICELYSYIDSGIPLVLFDGKYNHATVGLGYKRDISFEFNDSPIKALPKYDKNNYRLIGKMFNGEQVDNIKVYSDKIFYRNVIINDDNSFPYKSIALYENNSSNDRIDLSLLNLFGFIAPLYPRINIEYADVNDYSSFVIRDKGIELGFIEKEQTSVFTRIFLATANKCRQHLYEQSKNSEFAKKVYSILKTVELPKLCWVIEYSNHEEQNSGFISGFTLIDSTRSFNDAVIELFNCGTNAIEYYDNDKNTYITRPINLSKQSLVRYNRNLYEF